MPVVPTYPGVYIEEIPSGVHTITGVATSVAAFVGYTEQGPVDQPVHIFSYAEYERNFGGLTLDSPMSYAVNQFFENGGSEAYVVRVASGATSASLTLTASDGTAVIQITAASDGVWGNFVQVDIDYDTINPDSYFNLTATQYISQNGQMVPGKSETYRNLSMSWMNPNYFLTTINGASQLITVALVTASFATAGFSESGTPTFPVTIKAGVNDTVGLSVDGGVTQLIQLTPRILNSSTDVKNALQGAFASLTSPPVVAIGAAPFANTTVSVTSATNGQTSAVRFTNGGSSDACAPLKLGIANGGIEVEGAANRRPMQNGTLGGALVPFPAGLPAGGSIDIDVCQVGGAPINSPSPITLILWPGAAPTDANGLATAINAAFLTAPAAAQPYLANASAEVDILLGQPHLRLIPGMSQGNLYFKIQPNGGDTTANDLELVTPLAPPPPPPMPASPDAPANFGHYQLGSGVGDTNVPWVSAAVAGNNGGPPSSITDFGDPVAKTGFYSLDTVDIFNILCFPDVADNNAINAVLYPNALAYCTLRRAMLVVDLPKNVTTIAGAQTWMSTAGASILDSHVVAYFPRMMEADVLQNGNVHQFPNCGAMAGIWARTDAQRGVWKAPAGTEANILGALGTAYRMNNQENGVLNPLGLNCLRTFPVFGTVVWGARTMRGADALTDDYKYVPVRRLALFLEESLYRGTQWVVFEPNDEPLWAQIRLSVGSFMHSLFAQGAFAGQTPKDAYFVKCDDETTTPLDQDQGRVNIIVGFAPLRPAEFVIIQIQQIVSVGPT